MIIFHYQHAFDDPWIEMALCGDAAAAGKGLHVFQCHSRRVGTKPALAKASIELELPVPADVGCLQVRAKAHQGLVPYVPRLAVSFAQGPAGNDVCNIDVFMTQTLEDACVPPPPPGPR